MIFLPKQGETWDLHATLLNGIDINYVIAGADRTIVQVYSEGCVFCRKSIPFVNNLNQQQRISVIGMAGTHSEEKFKKHLSKFNVTYPFINYEGEYIEPAILKALGQTGWPNYLVLNNQKVLTGIYVGSEALASWLEKLPSSRY